MANIRVTEGSDTNNNSFAKEWSEAKGKKTMEHLAHPETNGPMTEAEWFLDHAASFHQGEPVKLLPNSASDAWIARWTSIVEERLGVTPTT